MHHKISFCYTNVENDSALAVTLIHGDKVPEEPMCEAKMDPETAAGSDRIDAKSPISSTTIANDGGGGEGKVTTTMTTTSPVVVMKGPLTPFSQDDEMSSDDLISVGGSPSPSVTTSPDTFSRTHPDDGCEEEYFKPLKKLRMLKVEPPSQGNIPGVKSFSITDILSHKPATPPALSKSSSHQSGKETSGGRHNKQEVVIQQRIVRPWDPQSKSNGRRNSSDSSPLDALFQMTSKTFEGLNGHHENSGGRVGSWLRTIIKSHPDRIIPPSYAVAEQPTYFEEEEWTALTPWGVDRLARLDIAPCRALDWVLRQV
ncbi:hypothetical protein Fcan01_21359 [Folsomia candida]|uniref:Uncharacterized protein n=1 Tax=Folsomia candida TaxID=158441 RepID=A0A226DHX6_FOLCA|nr:hypothetical protein Fcan01_21359 [Folsomia candida]